MTQTPSVKCSVCEAPIKRRGEVSFICSSPTCNTLYVIEAWREGMLCQHMWYEDVLNMALKILAENLEMGTLELAKTMYKLPISSESFDLCIPEIRRDVAHLHNGNNRAIRLPIDAVPFLQQVAAEWEYFIRGYKEKLSPVPPELDVKAASPKRATQVDDNDYEDEDEDDDIDDSDDSDDDDDDDDDKKTIGTADKLLHPPLQKSTVRPGKTLRLLERYKAGEHEAVWQDMISLEESVREEPVYSEAKLVADETMKRVRLNVETLTDRLAKIKFFDLYHGKKMPAFEPPESNVKEALDKIEKTIGLLPISMRSFCEQVGSITYFGSLKTATGVKCSYPDPLFVDLLSSVWTDYDEWEVDWYEGCDPLCATIAPDKYHKADVSGGSPYTIIIPNACADGFVLGDEPHDLMFVDYLRMCFRCGGLPGLALQHRAFADKLSKDLISF